MDTEVTGEPKESEESKGMETDAKEKKVEEAERERKGKKGTLLCKIGKDL